MGWIKKRWEMGLTDALGQNLALYFITFLISILLSLITSALSQETVPVTFDAVKFSRTLADCVLPTTITMGLGTFIQNYDAVSKNNIEHSGLNVILMILTLVYPFAYVLLRLYGVSWIDNFVFCGSIVIVVLGLFSISQIAQWQKADRPNLPPIPPPQGNSTDKKAWKLERDGRSVIFVSKETSAAPASGAGPSEAEEVSHARNSAPASKQ